MGQAVVVEHRHIVVLGFYDVDIGRDVLGLGRVIPATGLGIQMTNDLEVLLQVFNRETELPREFRHLVVLQ